MIPGRDGRGPFKGTVVGSAHAATSSHGGRSFAFVHFTAKLHEHSKVDAIEVDFDIDLFDRMSAT